MNGDFEMFPVGTGRVLQQALQALETYEQYIHPLSNYFGGPEVPREGSASAKVEDAIAAIRQVLGVRE